jgi:hypothetical protein
LHGQQQSAIEADRRKLAGQDAHRLGQVLNAWSSDREA